MKKIISMTLAVLAQSVASQAHSQDETIEERFSQHTTMKVPVEVTANERDKIPPGKEPTFTMQMTEEQKSAFYSDMKSLEEKGYIDKSTTPTRAAYNMARIKSLEESPGHSRPAANHYEKVASTAQVDADWLPFKPTQVAGKYLKDGGMKYVMRGTMGVKQIYDSTVFGVLIVDEVRSPAYSELHEPNANIDGRPAKITVIKHINDTWATKLMTIDGDNVLMLEADMRLEGQEQDDFLKLAGELLDVTR